MKGSREGKVWRGYFEVLGGMSGYLYFYDLSFMAIACRVFRVVGRVKVCFPRTKVNSLPYAILAQAIIAFDVTL